MMMTSQIVVISMPHILTIYPPQKGVGSFIVPAPCCAVQHEGEKHQESFDAHPQNQPEPRASREKSKPLLFCLSLPLLQTSDNTHVHKQHTLSRFLTWFPKIASPPCLGAERFSPLSTKDPLWGLILNFNESNENKLFILPHIHSGVSDRRPALMRQVICSFGIVNNICMI